MSPHCSDYGNASRDVTLCILVHRYERFRGTCLPPFLEAEYLSISERTADISGENAAWHDEHWAIKPCNNKLQIKNVQTSIVQHTILL